MTVVIMFVVMVMHPELELPSPATGGAFVLPLNNNKNVVEEPETEATTENIMSKEVRKELPYST